MKNENFPTYFFLRCFPNGLKMVPSVCFKPLHGEKCAIFSMTLPAGLKSPYRGKRELGELQKERE